MTSMKKDDLLRLLGEIIKRTKTEDKQEIVRFLNEPQGMDYCGKHSAYDWFLILKERLNP